MKKYKMINKKFNKLTIIQYTGQNKHGQKTCLCKCDCGKEKIITENNLLNKNSKSCGCSRKNNSNNLKHGHSRKNKHTMAYRIWAGILGRCNNKDNKDYKNYGGRLITICPRWLKFENFLEDMGKPLSNKHQIDRIKNDKGYYKENCHWVLPKINSRNRRNNHIIKYRGKELCLAEWEEVTGIKQETIRRRIKSNWSIEKALNTPV